MKKVAIMIDGCLTCLNCGESKCGENASSIYTNKKLP